MKKRTTKDILAESFVELAKTKRIDKITITEITSNCGMSQPTFYNHFKDKYDLMVWLHINSGNEIMSKIGKNGYEWRDTLYEGIRSYNENRDFVLNALKHTSGQDSFRLYVQQINYDLLVSEVRKKIMTEDIPDDILGMIKIYVMGTVQYILDWLISDMALSPEQIAEICERSLPEPLKQYLYSE